MIDDFAIDITCLIAGIFVGLLLIIATRDEVRLRDFASSCADHDGELVKYRHMGKYSRYQCTLPSGHVITFGDVR